jgi:ABC-2 type transport system permease protein
MLRSVFTKTLYDARIPLLAWAAGMGLLGVWFVSLFPAVTGSASALINSIMARLPDSLRLLIGNANQVTSFEGFLAAKMMNLVLPLLGIGFGLAYGSGLIGSEEEERSLDLLLSNPVPRWRVITEKYAALVVFTLVVYAACYAGLALTARVMEIETSYSHLLAGTLNMALLVLFFATLALCISGLRRGRGLATGVSVILAAVTFLTNNLHAITDMPDWVVYLSPWHYYDIYQVLTGGMNWGHAGLLAGLTVLLAALGTWGFSQRDLGA